MTGLARRAFAEFLGTAALVATIVGSGAAATELTEDGALRLGMNAAATVLALVAILVVLGPVSGAHLHPLVSIVDALLRRRSWRDVAGYVPAQLAGGIAGALLANVLFGMPLVTIGTQERATPAHLLSEVVASAALLFTVVVLARTERPRLAPIAVPALIGAAYVATSSTSFANPAVTIARILSDSYAGIAPASAALFIVAQVVGAAIGVAVARSVTPASDPVRGG